MADDTLSTPEEKTVDNNSLNPADNAGVVAGANTAPPAAQALETNARPQPATSASAKTGSESNPESSGGELDENSLDSKPDNTSVESESSTPVKESRFKNIRQRFNIYLIILVTIVLMAVAIILIAYLQSHSSSKNNNIQSQNLTQASLQELANSDSSVGSNQYVLNVESNAIFAGQVIIRQSLEIAGNLQVGGTGAFNNITVAGTGQFSQATINNNLSVGGNGSIQGSVTIAKNLQVSSGGSFGGPLSAPQITTSNLQLNGNLVLQRHISVTGSIPSRIGGTALGNGGSVSIGGTDTAGSITINTGDTPPAGCFVTVTFSAPFDNTPHVLVTPIGFSAGALQYYVNRSTTSFSVCDASPSPANTSFGFDYFIVD